MSLFHISLKKFLLTSCKTRGKLWFSHDKQSRNRLFSRGLWLLSIAFPFVIKLNTACKCYFRILCDYGRMCTLCGSFLRNYDGRFYSLKTELPVLSYLPSESASWSDCLSSPAPHWTPPVQQQVRGGGGLNGSAVFPPWLHRASTGPSPDTATWKGGLQPPRRCPEPSHSEGELLLHRPESQLVTVEIEVWETLKRGHMILKYLGVKMCPCYTIKCPQPY